MPCANPCFVAHARGAQRAGRRMLPIVNMLSTGWAKGYSEHETTVLTDGNMSRSAVSLPFQASYVPQAAHRPRQRSLRQHDGVAGACRGLCRLPGSGLHYSFFGRRTARAFGVACTQG